MTWVYKKKISGTKDKNRWYTEQLKIYYLDEIYHYEGNTLQYIAC